MSEDTAGLSAEERETLARILRPFGATAACCASHTQRTIEALAPAVAAILMERLKGGRS